MNRSPSSLNKIQIDLLKGLATRIAHQIDIQTEQKETTAASVQTVLKIFYSHAKSPTFNDLNAFLSLCLGKIISHDDFLKLSSLELAEYDSKKEMALSSKGISLQRQMKLQTKIMKRSIIKADDRPAFLDDLLGEL